MIMKPLFERVLLTLCSDDEESTNGVFVPRGGQEKILCMRVDAIGDEVRGITVGDKVVIHKYACSEVFLQNRKYYMANGQDVMGVVG